ncbi:hypothetical protein BFN03_03685 [Rhodococcus sp. WMMA185]|nr:hypothetical protein BFN03_03685 [Rhodococcus sp. WMMA185]
MRADLEVFRQKIAERRERDDAAAEFRLSGCGVPESVAGPMSTPAASSGELVEDDEFYHPRSWLV